LPFCDQVPLGLRLADSALTSATGLLFANEGPSFWECSILAEIAGATAIPILIHQPQNRELKMDHEAETKTVLLTTEIIRCIAKSLLASVEELERSLWHYSARTEHSKSSSLSNDDALSF
jgi:hypothetical protein